MPKDLVEELTPYLRIDKYGLDDAISGQPNLLYQISEAVAEAMAERDASKEELARIDAELDVEVRAKMEKEKRDPKAKITEAMVTSRIMMNRRHEEAFDTFMLAKRDADKLLALKEAFQQRGYMLRELASLYVASYYEQSSVQGNSRTDAAVYKRNRERLAEGRAARKRDADDA